MFPVQTITQLSPNAAKLYLLFISLCNPADPMTRISRPRLAQLAAFSIRTCSKALVELRKLDFLNERNRFVESVGPCLNLLRGSGEFFSEFRHFPSLVQTVSKLLVARTSH